MSHHHHHTNTHKNHNSDLPTFQAERHEPRQQQQQQQQQHCQGHRSHHPLSERTRWRLELWGWLLFTVSAVIYGVAAWRIRDWWNFSASAAFFVADILFLMSYLGSAESSCGGVVVGIPAGGGDNEDDDEKGDTEMVTTMHE